ncbi:uncharacterized protein sS8_2119 [Methylocaldum marinum]|uniref:Uncharacterized protein n=1 Tax=Methylocaldum marinum TaxID=1432792 RepID=A0A250KSZ2_9GAMM|nr:uncharacterized protein sS8_2119 [Methylocaldum marinum]
MFQSIVVVSKGAARVVGRIDEHTFDLASEFLLQGFERQQVVPEDQPVIENVAVRNPVFGMVGLFRIFEQDARL